MMIEKIVFPPTFLCATAPTLKRGKRDAWKVECALSEIMIFQKEQRKLQSPMPTEHRHKG